MASTCLLTVLCVLTITESVCVHSSQEYLESNTYEGKQEDEDDVHPSGNKHHDGTIDFGKPLFLTPYIESGNIEKAKQVAQVEPFCCNVTSYSGFLTLNKEHNSNMFFWFFPAEIDSDTAPLLLWLHGGPGDSAIGGVFDQTGPFCLTQNLTIVPRKYYWTKTMSIIYIDNPVGTGFSFTRKIQDYARNESDIAENLYIALTQFLQIFTKFVENDFYIFGQSYGGKFAAALAHLIEKNNENLLENQRKVNLKGILFNSAHLDPIQATYLSAGLYQIGAIDCNTYLEVKKLEENLMTSIKQENYLISSEIASNMKDFLQEKTGYENFDNLLTPTALRNFEKLSDFFKNPDIRNKIHVGKLKFNEGVLVKECLSVDKFKSVKPLVATLVEKYKMLISNGQLDFSLSYTTTESFLFSLNWSRAEEYRTAERILWYVDDELAGYRKTVGNFTEVLVRNGEHVMPVSQPKWCFDLFHRFTRDLL